MKIIACYSNKGGVGKTAAAVNLAHVFAASGQRVLLCDLDPQGAAGFYFRVKPSRKLSGARFFQDDERFIKAIRASDYDNLDILPANAGFRDFDIFLSRMRDKDSQLKKALKVVKGDYDLILLDCPPNFSALSENIFRAAEAIVVPVIPTTLSERTFQQLEEFFEENDLPTSKLHGFFSMVQGIKLLHGETMHAMRKTWPAQMMQAQIPFASDIERMGISRAPVTASAPRSNAAQAYRALHQELSERIGL